MGITLWEFNIAWKINIFYKPSIKWAMFNSDVKLPDSIIGYDTDIHQYQYARMCSKIRYTPINWMVILGKQLVIGIWDLCIFNQTHLMKENSGTQIRGT